ncbi:MAG: pyridoxamine 5'-phosphate oxidase family protein [Acidobacteria bacterium]|nr:pyridoxamine 5'-phosphate oxidase family protein [Acidobacteriota bacterium]
MAISKSRKRRSRKQLQPKASRPFMPGYGLPGGTKGLLSWEWAEQRLKKSHNYWVATMRPDGRPHVMVVWGLWLDGALYFSTGRQSRKARNLEANSNCVICTERADQAVIMEGVAREVPERAIRRKFLTLYERKYKWDMSSFEDDILSLKEPIYAVYPSAVFGLDEKKSLQSATRWEFPA